MQFQSERFPFPSPFKDTDYKGQAYEELVGANLKGVRGDFITPRNIQKMSIKMLNIKSNENTYFGNDIL